MAASPHILLIGLRGAGKSSIAQRLSQRLGRPWLDLDALTPGLCGCEDVAGAWGMWGWRGFRNAEARAMTAVLFDGSIEGRAGHGASDAAAVISTDAGCIVALGGGTPTAPGVDEAILLAAELKRAAAVYLRAAPAALRERLETADNRHRPSLTGGDTLDEIEQVFAERDPLYGELASLVVETAGLTEDEVVTRIVEFTREA